VATAEELDKGIADLLAQKVQGDYLLASTLFAFWKNQGYRLMGYRSVAEYLRERFRGQEQDHAARMHARGFQRLIREFKLAQEIPAFREAFDSISRSNRRLIAQVITKDNAEIWIAHAKTLNYRELEEKIVTLPAEKKNDGVVTKRLRLYPDQLEILDRAFDIARGLVEADGKDPNGPEGPLVEMIVQEFLSTYATDDATRKRPEWSYFQCPECGVFTGMLRRPEQDVAVDDGIVRVYECRKCSAGVAVKAFG
jgi:hypothetical protein